MIGRGPEGGRLFEPRGVLGSKGLGRVLTERGRGKVANKRLSSQSPPGPGRSVPLPHGEGQAGAAASAAPTAAGDPAAPAAPRSAPAAGRGLLLSGSGRRTPSVAARLGRGRHGLVVQGGPGVGRPARGTAAAAGEAGAGVAAAARAIPASGPGRRRRRLARAGAAAAAEARAAAAAAAAASVPVRGRPLQARVAPGAAPGAARQGREAGAGVRLGAMGGAAEGRRGGPQGFQGGQGGRPRTGRRQPPRGREEGQVGGGGGHEGRGERRGRQKPGGPPRRSHQNGAARESPRGLQARRGARVQWPGPRQQGGHPGPAVQRLWSASARPQDPFDSPPCPPWGPDSVSGTSSVRADTVDQGPLDTSAY